MKDIQAILHEIVSDLEKTAAGLTVLSVQVLKVSPLTGYEAQEMMNIAQRNNQQLYDGLRKKIDDLT
jgi:hypothetical protein